MGWVWDTHRIIDLRDNKPLQGENDNKSAGKLVKALEFVDRIRR